MLNSHATIVAEEMSALQCEFQRIVQRDHSRLTAAAQRILGCADLALDAVQDGCLSAWQALATFRGQARLSTWLHRIVLNAALMRRRARRSRRELVWTDCADDRAMSIPVGDAAGLGGAELETAEQVEQIKSCLRTLPTPYQEILSLRISENLDTRETGRRLNITPTAAKVRLHRAVGALRARLLANAA